MVVQEDFKSMKIWFFGIRRHEQSQEGGTSRSTSLAYDGRLTTNGLIDYVPRMYSRTSRAICMLYVNRLSLSSDEKK